MDVTVGRWEDQFRMNCFCSTPRVQVSALGSVIGYPNLYSIAASLRTCMADQSHTAADHFSTLLRLWRNIGITRRTLNVYSQVTL